MFCHYRLWWIQGPSYADIASTGVDLFFVLSGFVFAPTLLHGLSSYAAFMVRRVFRIYPLYLIALALYALLETQDFDIKALLAHLLMLQTSFSMGIAFFYNPVFWSLPPEWAFYCTMPLLILAVRAWGLGLCIVLALIIRVGLGVCVEPPLLPSDQLTWVNWAVINLPGIAAEFSLGVLVYWAHYEGAFTRYRSVVGLFFAASLLLT